ncbi:MAG: metallophosphoesterase [Candidatus Devosia phytovorans]|uniref:Metallophosphoesterase n=1 Tax=Candidatus Devosia phytovorans TaxID=3121372 RepID=A0AAJ5VVZ2_9HYPH|nr:metallophosphoesterase [Devosia sp.]WEK04905.1 MAG: metallophosphoesterase [Devosia sp.]
MTVVTRYAPALPNWPGDLKLRVAVLSDFHGCWPFMNAGMIHRIGEQAMALEPDIILLLGDFVGGPRFSRELTRAELVDAFAGFAAPLGVHAVMGNHDYDHYTREQVLAGEVVAIDALREAGVEVHVNRSQRIAHGGKAFWLAGLGDQRAFHRRGMPYEMPGLGIEDLDGTLAQVTDDAPILLMAHEPDIFPKVPNRVALTLSGHTHGGQIKLFGRTPVVPSLYGSRYVYGHVVEEGRHLIVSSGLGYSGWPVRFATSQEIVLLELGGAA